MDSLSFLALDCDQSIASSDSGGKQQNSSVQMDRILALVEHGRLDSSSDESSLFSHNSFSLYEQDDCSVKEEEEAKYDDMALSDLIVKLRGGPLQQSETDENGAAAEEKEEGDLTDDLIAQHLKALANKSKRHNSYSQHEELSETEEMSTSSYSESDDTMSVVSCDTSYTMDDESVIDIAAYQQVDEVMKKLGVNVDIEAEKEESRQWLESVQQRNAFDYTDAPQTISSKKVWLANLAVELMHEDSGDDESVCTNLSTMDHIYEQSRNGLANETKLAEALIAKSTEPQEDEPVGTELKSKPKRQWKKPIAPVKSTSTAADLLAEHARALALKQPVVSPVPTVLTVTPEEDANEIVGPSNPPKKSVLDHVSRKTPSWSKPKKKTVADQLREKALAINNLKPISSHQPTATTPVKPVSLRAVSPISAERIQTEEEKLSRSRQNLKSVEKESVQAKTEKSESAKLLTELVKIATIERSQQPATDKTETPKVATLPSGLPPYPGYGPKWPWHPDSPRAPEGYRECYMQHMGEYYHQYMSYLRTRVANDDSENTKTEEIMRASLSSQASFKKGLTIKPRSYRRKKKKTRAIVPTSFASRPGRARKNCAVPTSLPSIEEISNSSAGSSGSEQKPSLETQKIAQKKTKPAVLTVGKIHPKSKGKVHKIIVVSGKELDKQAKEEKKSKKAKKIKQTAPGPQRQCVKSAAASTSESSKTRKKEISEPITTIATSSSSCATSAKSAHSRGSSKTSKKTLAEPKTEPKFPEQPSTTTAATTQCACVIM